MKHFKSCIRVKYYLSVDKLFCPLVRRTYRLYAPVYVYEISNNNNDKP